MAKTWKTTARLQRKLPRQTGQYIAHRETVEVPLEFEIDWQGLAVRLGQKALDNRSGRSSFLAGLIKVKARKDKLPPVGGG